MILQFGGRLLGSSGVSHVAAATWRLLWGWMSLTAPSNIWWSAEAVTAVASQKGKPKAQALFWLVIFYWPRQASWPSPESMDMGRCDSLGTINVQSTTYLYPELVFWKSVFPILDCKRTQSNISVFA